MMCITVYHVRRDTRPDKRAVAVEFNHYFTNTGKSVASKPPQGINFKKYMNLTSDVGNIYLFPNEPLEVLEIINKMKAKKKIPASMV